MNSTLLKLSSLALLMLLFSVSSLAATVKGVVTDADGERVPFSTIVFCGTGITVTANQYGEYEARDVPEGKLTVKGACLGYVSVQKEVSVGTGDCQLDFSLPLLEITLKEAVVVGVDNVGQTLENLRSVPPLQKKVRKYTATALSRVESVGNLHEFPADLRKVLRTASKIMGYGKVYACMERHPKFWAELNRQVKFNNSYISTSGGTFVAGSAALSEDEKRALAKKKWEADFPVYAWMYGVADSIAEKCAKQRRAGLPTGVAFKGEYEEDGHTVRVLAANGCVIHVVTDCWQILRMESQQGSMRRVVECSQLLPGLYLPVSMRLEQPSNLDSKHKWDMVTAVTYNYTDFQMRGK